MHDTNLSTIVLYGASPFRHAHSVRQPLFDPPDDAMVDGAMVGVIMVDGAMVDVAMVDPAMVDGTMLHDARGCSALVSRLDSFWPSKMVDNAIDG